MENFDEKKSWEVIQRMVHSTKKRADGGSVYFLIWGWAVLLASVIQYLMLLANSEYNYLVWPVFMPAAAIVHTIVGRRQERTKTVDTYFDVFIRQLWLVVGTAVIITLITQSLLGNFKTAYSAILVLYGIGTIATGLVLDFKPLTAGGLVSWLCSLSLAFIDFPEALLVLAFAVLCSYLVPGYMLRYKYRKEKATKKQIVITE